MGFRGRTVVLTGASSGTGLALSRLLAKERDDILRRLAARIKK